MYKISNKYLSVLKQRDFFHLILMILFGQLATSFLMLSLIVSVFSETGSAYSVSGVILSFTVPAFLLMAFAGLAADIFDRRKIMITAYGFLSLVVLFILTKGQSFSSTIPLSFLYFAGNTFFIPSSSAATAQLVKKEHLLTANSIFIFTMSTALLSGFFLASLIQFFFGHTVSLIFTLGLLLIAIALGISLPKLLPIKVHHPALVQNVLHNLSGFKVIMKSKIVWYFFFMFALMQGIILFGVTLAPGFFQEVIGISIDKSPLFVVPIVGIGGILGTLYIHRPNLKESTTVAYGLSIIGIFTALLGLLMNTYFFNSLVLPIIAIYLIVVGFGTIILMIATRTVIQKEVPHNNQGIVFAANMILSSLLIVFMSPLAAYLVESIGFMKIMVYGGLMFLLLSAVFAHFSNRWKF